jgi:hypothetical protein
MKKKGNLKCKIENINQNVYNAPEKGKLNDPFFKTLELAERWGCCPGTIRNKKDSLDWFKTPGGREYRFSKDSVFEYEQKQMQSRKEVSKKTKKKRKALSTPKKIWRVE